MIGVCVSGIEEAALEEFFELFKTPWEMARKGRRFSALLTNCPAADLPLRPGGLLIAASHQKLPLDERAGLQLRRVASRGGVLKWGRRRLPVYGPLASFDAPPSAQVLASCGTEATALQVEIDDGPRIARLGYDLLQEAAGLLSFPGQPEENALIPTLERHIALLRSILLRSGIPLIEVPPAPAGTDFISCLTHDVDFCGIGRHRFDRTAAGFLCRALLKTPLQALQGTRSLDQLAANWKAALSLPLVHMGLAKDFWQPFQSYLEAESGSRSTFFVVPFKGRPGGKAPQGAAEPRRAVPYQASEVAGQLRKAVARQCEVGVHGLDAWADAAAGRLEKEQVEEASGQAVRGIRMHWLYFDQDSPQALEEAGYGYDSSWGYNGAVGYRAGTSQAFRWLSARRLFELPLLFQDTALFYPDRMGLREDQAAELFERLLANAQQWGGTFVVNWHGRSLAPERLWGGFHRRLLERLRNSRTCFLTAAQAVDWFQARREVRFEGRDGQSVRMPRRRGAPGAIAVRRWSPEEEDGSFAYRESAVGTG